MTAISKTGTTFLRNLLDEKVSCPFTGEEIVSKGVHKLLKRLMDNILLPSCIISHRIVKVGSMAEGTSIIRPNEFDFILAVELDGIEIKRNCYEGNGYAHVKVTDQSKYKYTLENWLNDDGYLRGCFIRSSATGQTFRNAFESFKSKVKSNRPAKPATSDPMFDSLQNALMYSISATLCSKHFIPVEECETGKVEIQRIVKKHGPALMLNFIWEPKEGPKMDIEADVTLALETNLSEDTIKITDVFHPKFLDKLNENGKYMLIACHHSATCRSGLCHRLTFTETEVELVRGLSEHHKNCYKLTKYIFHSGGSYQYISSYALKTIVLKHDCSCREQSDLFKCFKIIVANLIHFLINRITIDLEFIHFLNSVVFGKIIFNESVDPTALLRLFIPGKKFKLHIPSIFIKDHNILDSKDYPFPCEQFLMAIEYMLISLKNIGHALPGETKYKNLFIVNSHLNGYRSYMMSLPFSEPFANIVHCLKCYCKYHTPENLTEAEQKFVKILDMCKEANLLETGFLLPSS